MKKILVLFLTSFFVCSILAQDTINTVPTPPPPPAKPKKDWSKVNLANRSNDHFMVQIGYVGWGQKPDSIQTKGFSRGFNMYFMMDFPFKTNPHFSVALGAGVSTTNVFFKNTYIDVSGRNANRLVFENVKDTSHFKKFKLVNTYLEIPVELRYISNPENSNKSWKFAAGIKIGTQISAGTKGKNLLNKSGNNINSFVQKEKAKRFFNGTRFTATGRIGYGFISLFYTYQLNNYIKEGFGPNIRPYSIGLTFSGL